VNVLIYRATNKTREKISKNTSAGLMGHTMSEETKNKISAKLKGRVFSEETKEKMRIARLRFLEKENNKTK
jgi:hypothetical protein